MLQFGVMNVTGVSISIPSLNREFIKIMGLNSRSIIVMTNCRRSSVYALIIIALLAVSIGLGQAMITTLAVKGGEEVTYPITLAVEDRVLIQFSVAVVSAVGEHSNTVHCSIVFPNGTVRDFGDEPSFSFVCDMGGEYTLHFVNNDQTAEKRVTLNYEIDHYIFGIPQMLFMALIIVLACVGGVFAFVILGRKS
jgi:hypothetical protein